MNNERAGLTIDHVDGSISYAEFQQRYLIPNLPCLLGKQLTKDWPAFQLWQAGAGKGPGVECGLHHSFLRLASLHGSHRAPFVIERPDGSLIRLEDVALDEAVAQMAEGKRLATGNFYVKDWHLIRQELRLAEEEGRAPLLPYITPDIFADDWMNSNLDARTQDDFRFCYAGSAGSRTNIHRDVYTSYSWSTNVVGSKRWRLFPPECVRFMRKFPDVETSELAADVDQMQAWLLEGKLGKVKEGKAGWPGWQDAMKHCQEIVQGVSKKSEAIHRLLMPLLARPDNIRAQWLVPRRA
jgi:hypothetical protein